LTGISLLATAITLASFGATYSINMKSFTDWGEFSRAFALLASADIEVTFALTLFGVAYALVGWIEKGRAARRPSPQTLTLNMMCVECRTQSYPTIEGERSVAS